MKKVFAAFVLLTVFKFSSAQSVGGAVGGSTTVCSGTNSGLLTLSGHTGNVVRWQFSTTAGASWTNITNTTINLVYANLTGTTWYRAEILLPPSPPNISVFSAPAVITVDAASSGTVNTSVSVCSGANSGILSLTGVFTNVTGWDSSTDGGSTWLPIANTSTTQNYSNLTATTIYRATITNGVCPLSIATAATITVNPLSVGGSISASDTVCESSNSGTLLLTGNTGNIIRWQSSDNNGLSWSNISNTTSVYNFSNIEETTEYRVVVQSGNCTIINSSPVIITVDPASFGGNISSSTTVCSGINNGTLELTGQTGNVLNWEQSIDNGSSWNTISNTSDTLSYFNLTAKTLYRVTVQSGICPVNKSTTATINISSASVGGTILGNDTVCSGSNSGTLTLTSHTGSVLRWQSSDDGGISWSNITSTTGATTCNYANVTTTTDFRAVVQNGSCPADNSSFATITVPPVSVGGSLFPESYSACNGINNGIILLNGQSGNIIRWESSINGGITWSQIANTSTILSFNNLTTTTSYRTLVQNGQCPPAYSDASTISIFTSSVGGIISASDTVCAGTNNGTLILNGFTGDILNWEYSKNGGATWSNISNTSPIQNYTNLTVTTMYRAVIQSGSCATANSSIVTITVNPATAGGNVLSSITVCDSTAAGTLTLSGHTGNILNWKLSIDDGSTWTTIANTTNTQIYSGITTATIYKAVVQSPGCASENSAPATISLSMPASASYSFTASGATAIFTNTSTSNSGTSAWNFGDNTSSTVTNPAHTYTATGSYSVRLIISDSCGSDTITQTVIITGLGTQNLSYNNPQVNIYPNPFQNSTTIYLSLENSSATIFKMLDVYGKEVRNINIDRSTKSLSLDRNELPAGIYFYQMNASGKTIASGKIIIQ